MNVAQISRIIEYIRHKYLGRNKDVEFDAEWEEKLHPRAENGQFTSGNGSAGGSTVEESTGEKQEKPKTNNLELSSEMKPKNTGYNFSLKDGFMDFQHKNAGNKAKPTPLFNLYHEVKNKGGDGLEAVEDEYYKTRLSACTEGLEEIGNDKAFDILQENLDPGVRHQWMMEYNHEIKPKFLCELTKSPEVHNAALNMMYINYKEQCRREKKEPLSYQEFLVTPVKMYRGGTGEEYKKASVFSSYTFDKKVAGQFKASETGHGDPDADGVIYEAEIRPIDTYGSLNTNGEMEVFVPRNIAPNGNRDEDDTRADDDSWITINSTHVLVDNDTREIKSGPERLREHSKKKGGSGGGASSFLGKNSKVPSKDEITSGKATYGGIPVLYDAKATSDASNFTTEIHVSPKFFEHPEEAQRHILNHEVAHNYSDDMMAEHSGDWNEFASNFIQEKSAPESSTAYKNGTRKYWEGLYGDIGATALSETVTRAITEYLDDPGSLKKRSESAFNLIKEFIDKKM